MNNIERTTRGITNMITNPTYISYGFLGISSFILGYYTLFDNKIDEVVSEPSPKQESIVQAPIQESTLPSFTQESTLQQMQGGKKNKKKTRRSKSKAL